MGFTIDDLMYTMIIILIYFQGGIYQVISDAINSALPNLGTAEALIAKLIPLLILIGIVRTIVEKARTPQYVYEES